MGLQIEKETFEDEEYTRFSQRLDESLDVLGEVLARPGFGQGAPTIGAELEMFLVDAAGFPLPINRQVLRQTVDPRVTVEISRFNLECNLRPGPLAGRPFTALREEFESALAEVRRAAATPGRARGGDGHPPHAARGGPAAAATLTAMPATGPWPPPSSGCASRSPCASPSRGRTRSRCSGMTSRSRAPTPRCSTTCG